MIRLHEAFDMIQIAGLLVAATGRSENRSFTNSWHGWWFGNPKAITTVWMQKAVVNNGRNYLSLNWWVCRISEPSTVVSNYLCFNPVPGEMIQSDEYFPKGLKQPTRYIHSNRFHWFHHFTVHRGMHKCFVKVEWVKNSKFYQETTKCSHDCLSTCLIWIHFNLKLF